MTDAFIRQIRKTNEANHRAILWKYLALSLVLIDVMALVLLTL